MIKFIQSNNSFRFCIFQGAEKQLGKDFYDWPPTLGGPVVRIWGMGGGGAKTYLVLLTQILQGVFHHPCHHGRNPNFPWSKWSTFHLYHEI